MILELLEKNIPVEIIYSNILPFTPFGNITKDILTKQQKKMSLYSALRKYLQIEDDAIVTDILRKYHDQAHYYYEDDYMFLYLKIDPKTLSLQNYIFLTRD